MRVLPTGLPASARTRRIRAILLCVSISIAIPTAILRDIAGHVNRGGLGCREYFLSQAL
jgi:hypothetical protein